MCAAKVDYQRQAGLENSKNKIGQLNKLRRKSPEIRLGGGNKNPLFGGQCGRNCGLRLTALVPQSLAVSVVKSRSWRDCGEK